METRTSCTAAANSILSVLYGTNLTINHSLQELSASQVCLLWTISEPLNHPPLLQSFQRWAWKECYDVLDASKAQMKHLSGFLRSHPCWKHSKCGLITSCHNDWQHKRNGFWCWLRSLLHVNVSWCEILKPIIKQQCHTRPKQTGGDIQLKTVPKLAFWIFLIAGRRLASWPSLVMASALTKKAWKFCAWLQICDATWGKLSQEPG